MANWQKILLAVGFSVLATILAMVVMEELSGLEIPAPYWVFGFLCPACVSAPVSIILARQAEINRRLNGQLMVAQAELLAQADLDHLTGVLNRAAFYRRASGYAGEAEASVLLADIDHFKAINDAHGHAAGDDALRLVARTLQAALRTDDLLGRVGGEEFAILLAGMPQPLAMLIAERARKAIAGLDVQAEDGKPIALSVSIGVSAYVAGEPLDTALARADAAMYCAKRGGRNRVQAAG